MGVNNKHLLIVVFFSLVSCKGEKDDGIKPIIGGKPVARIELFNNKADFPIEQINLSEFVDSVGFIRLETTEECLINNINSVFFIDEEIVIVDKMSGKILVFDNNGSYIRKIANRGRGPGEYLDITSCNYDSEKQMLSIYDDHNHKLLLYSIQNNFIKEIKIMTENNAPIRDMINLPEGHYLCYNETSNFGDYSGLWKIDSEGNFVESLFKYGDDFPSVYRTYYSYFQQLPDGSITIMDIVHNDIYNYKKGELRRYIAYEIENNKQYKNKGVRYTEDHYLYSSTAQNKGNYIIGFWADENSALILSFYDKKLNKMRFTEAFDDSDVDDAIWIYKMIDSNVNNALLIDLSSMFVTWMLKQEDTPAHTRDILNRLNSGMSEDEIEKANPIIEILYLKK
jgi:hypothetical protein